MSFHSLMTMGVAIIKTLFLMRKDTCCYSLYHKKVWVAKKLSICQSLLSSTYLCRHPASCVLLAWEMPLPQKTSCESSITIFFFNVSNIAVKRLGFVFFFLSKQQVYVICLLKRNSYPARRFSNKCLKYSHSVQYKWVVKKDALFLENWKNTETIL